MDSLMTIDPRSTAEIFDNVPPNFPMAVRTAPVRTISLDILVSSSIIVIKKEKYS
jgi:hypothetical protein